MRSLLKFLGALIIALLAMLAFRAFAFTIYTVPGEGLEPAFLRGDRVMVNRWSYGLRTGGEGLFAYARVLRQPVKRGDIVALNDSSGQVVICRCTAVPGDSVIIDHSPLNIDHSPSSHLSPLTSPLSAKIIVPGVVNCADKDYYAMQPLSWGRKKASSRVGLEGVLYPEESIIGRVCLIVYNHADSLPFWRGYRSDRWMLSP